MIITFDILSYIDFKECQLRNWHTGELNVDLSFYNEYINNWG